jgi:hypothetical protein
MAVGDTLRRTSCWLGRWHWTGLGRWQLARQKWRDFWRMSRIDELMMDEKKGLIVVLLLELGRNEMSYI